MTSPLHPTVINVSDSFSLDFQSFHIHECLLIVTVLIVIFTRVNGLSRDIIGI